MAVSVFSFQSYKEFILQYVRSEGEPWGYWNKIAKAISCQPAYLSKCVKGSTHLTIDHLVALSHFWSLRNMDEDYLLAIFEAEKAGKETAKRHLFQKAKRIKETHENIKDRLKKDSLEKIEQQALYYSNWLWMAIHFLTSISKYQSEKSISQRLQIPLKQISMILHQLQNMGLVENTGESWRFLTGEFHLGKESPLISTHHHNWRDRAVMNAQNPLSDGVHYSAVYAMSEGDFDKMKNEILNLIDTSRKTVASSPEEEIFCLNTDLFRI